MLCCLPIPHSNRQFVLCICDSAFFVDSLVCCLYFDSACKWYRPVFDFLCLTFISLSIMSGGTQLWGQLRAWLSSACHQSWVNRLWEWRADLSQKLLSHLVKYHDTQGASRLISEGLSHFLTMLWPPGWMCRCRLNWLTRWQSPCLITRMLFAERTTSSMSKFAESLERGNSLWSSG